MLRYPKHDGITEGKGHNKHTDVGTLTFLLCKQWGLQILSPDTASWAFVEPREGHAVVNVGDSLRFVSGFRFASVVHRVTPLYDVQHEDRYSIAYFLRMADNATFRDQDGKAWSAKDWHDFKFNIFRKPFDLPGGTRFLTGGMESGDVLLRKEIAG
jgi:isopenicillin N synthase-like dioxygenase